MAQISRYKYTVTLNFIDTNNTEINILNPCIAAIAINYDYEKFNMPIIFIILNIESSLYTKIISGIGKANFMLNISKYDVEATNPVVLDYVKSMFSYYMDSNPNLTKDLDTYVDNSGQAYKRCTIGLLKKELINNNKVVFNQIFRNTNMIGIVHKCTAHMKMVIEPFSYNSNIGQLIIPPLNSVSSLIKYLNNYNNFYNGNYRYFMDFNQTYLLSTSGNPIDAMDGQYLNVSIDIKNTMEDLAQSLGLIKDDAQRIYIIYFDILNTKIQVNNISKENATRIVGVSTSGEVLENTIKMFNTAEGISDRTVFKRIPNNNSNIMKTYTNNAELNNVILSVTKSEIDNSILTPNKEYIINNFEGYNEYNGRYLLAYKKEILLQKDEEFMSNTTLGLRKIME